jgi:hypothetical protein
MTLDEAKALIERMKTYRVTCPECERVSMAKSPCPDGFEEDPARPWWVKRCRVCQDTPMYPWADKLDPERVVKYEASRPKNEWVWELAGLESTI